jgi:hypothetical protein
VEQFNCSLALESYPAERFSSAQLLELQVIKCQVAKFWFTPVMLHSHLVQCSLHLAKCTQVLPAKLPSTLGAVQLATAAVLSFVLVLPLVQVGPAEISRLRQETP